MSSYKNIDDTIVAISTAAGQGGIGIVRLSGNQSLVIADQMFQSHNGRKPSEFKSFTVHYGWIMKEKEMIDEVLLTVMKEPKSYTKEDMVEISCHGGTVPLRAILKLACDFGARLAEPGEFTKRAYLNGRIDLTQAEAVLDIIQAKTDTFLRVSTNQLKGELSTELEAIREYLMHAYVEIEALVNFPEDDIEVQARGRLKEDLQSATERVAKLLRSSEQGRILKEGIKIVLCGKPNVGKSSLLNILLKTPRAIVSEIAGTTRDTIEETAQIQGIPFQIVDTAGILEPRDVIEQEAVRRSHLSIASADLVLFIVDASQNLTDEDNQLIENIKDKTVLVVFNKCDLPARTTTNDLKKVFKNFSKVSALKKTGIEELEETIVKSVGHNQKIDTHGLLISNVRHINALKDCQKALQKARQNFDDNLSLEFLSEDIKMAVHHLDAITGRNIDTDLLETIFSQFCIGK